jgi:hypothetical protein
MQLSTSQLLITPSGSTDGLSLTGGTGTVGINASGGSTNIQLNINSKGGGGISLSTGGGQQLSITNTASATRWITLTGSNGGNPTISTSGGLLAVGVAILGAGSIFAQGSTSMPVGGTIGAGFLMSNTANFGLFFGSGVPTLSAAQGSVYLRSDGSPYYNADGSTTWNQIGGSATAIPTTITAGTTTPTGTSGEIFYECDPSSGQIIIDLTNGPQQVTLTLKDPTAINYVNNIVIKPPSGKKIMNRTADNMIAINTRFTRLSFAKNSSGNYTL